MTNLSAAGLSPTESKCYYALLQQKSWKPSDLAKSVNETRTNCYKVLDNLVAVGLAERFDQDKKLHYRATNPGRLLELARERRAAQEQAEKELELQTQKLMNDYVQVHEQAGVRYFQGKHEISEIYRELATTRDQILFIHSIAGIQPYGFETIHNLRMLAPLAGVKRRALTTDNLLAHKDFLSKDPQVLLERTWIAHEDYTAPVEWGVFDNKLYIISFGSEALGMIIESPAIAASFRELFVLLERGQKLSPDYKNLPHLAQASGVTIPAISDR